MWVNNMNRHFSKEDIYEANKHEKLLIITGHQKNANQNHIEIPSHALEWRSSKNLETTDAGEDVEKKQHFYTVGGSVNWFNYCGRHCGDSSVMQKQKCHLTQESHYWLKWYFQRIINHSIILYNHYNDYKSFHYKDTCTLIFIAVLFTIAKTWNQAKC